MSEWRTASWQRVDGTTESNHAADFGPQLMTQLKPSMLRVSTRS
ncbi:MAG: hypothetical protein RRA51_00580 [Armatimonadota bacterium]|nr:hypothetical protein [Armatimonadota bacterium]